MAQKSEKILTWAISQSKIREPKVLYDSHNERNNHDHRRNCCLRQRSGHVHQLMAKFHVNNCWIHNSLDSQFVDQIEEFRVSCDLCCNLKQTSARCCRAYANENGMSPVAKPSPTVHAHLLLLNRRFKRDLAQASLERQFSCLHDLVDFS